MELTCFKGQIQIKSIFVIACLRILSLSTVIVRCKFHRKPTITFRNILSRTKALDQFKLWRRGGTGWKVITSSKWLEFILWGWFVSLPKFYLLAIRYFTLDQSGLTDWQAEQLTAVIIRKQPTGFYQDNNLKLQTTDSLVITIYSTAYMLIFVGNFAE